MGARQGGGDACENMSTQSTKLYISAFSPSGFLNTETSIGPLLSEWNDRQGPSLFLKPFIFTLISAIRSSVYSIDIFIPSWIGALNSACSFLYCVQFKHRRRIWLARFCSSPPTRPIWVFRCKLNSWRVRASQHLPMFFAAGFPQYTDSFFHVFPIYVLTVTFWSIIMTLLYNQTDGSILICMIFHAALNIAAFTIHVPNEANIMEYLYTPIIIVSIIPLPRPLFTLHVQRLDS